MTQNRNTSANSNRMMLIFIIGMTIILVYVTLLLNLTQYGYGKFNTKITYSFNNNVSIDSLIIGKFLIDNYVVFKIDSITNNLIFKDSILIDSGIHTIQLKSKTDKYKYSDTIVSKKCYLKYKLGLWTYKHCVNCLTSNFSISLELYFGGKKRNTFIEIVKS